MPIVAAVDRSSRAGPVIEQARELADRYETDLHVVHVGGGSSVLSGEPPAGTGLSFDRDRVRDRMAEVAAEAAETVLDDDAFEAVGLVGDPATRLVEYADARDAEYIVVSSRKRSPIGKALLGSVTQSLLLEADRPVVAVAGDPES